MTSSLETETGKVRTGWNAGSVLGLPVFRAKHFMAAYVKKSTPRVNTSRPFPPAAVKALMNCNDCHEKAGTGSFAYKEIVVPGVTKVVKPGGLF